jgi:hypothetical protein
MVSFGLGLGGVFLPVLFGCGNTNKCGKKKDGSKRESRAGKTAGDKGASGGGEEDPSECGEENDGGECEGDAGGYIKLLQLTKEMGEEPKTAITVTWIEEPEENPIEE